MSETEETTDEDRGLIQIGDFQAPALPTQEVFRGWIARAHAMVRKSDDVAFVADDRLQRATLDRLDEVVAPPAAAPVLDDLDATITPWLAGPPARGAVKLLVVPPCDELGVVAAWARQRGHGLIPPPDRLASRPAVPDLDALPAQGLLVVPALDRWFLRERGGLALVRDLLDRLDRARRPVLVACNSWAWRYLRCAVDADAALPSALVVRPFDADRLRRWLGALARDDLTGGMRFRLSSSGHDILGDDAGEDAGEFFQRLAAKSRGIPWVAWHLWRRSLRRDRETEDGDLADEIADPGRQTLWIAALDQMALPGNHPQAVLLVLHALLIHGRLTIEELRRVLPIVGPSNVVAVLLKSGFIERDDDGLRCSAAAYPAIRDGLVSGGYPKDDL